MATVRTWRDRETGQLTNRITIRVERHMDLDAMANGLCSRYVRNEIEEGLELPESLSVAKILEAVREEYEYYGSNAVWTWSDDVPDSDEYMSWARSVIITAFPEMGQNR